LSKIINIDLIQRGPLEVLLIMGKKVPLMNGSKLREQYNLDDQSDRSKLNLPNVDPSHPPKTSDRYVIYQNGKSAVVELKSSTIHKAIKQLETTIKSLLDAGKKVDYAVIVSKKINRYERRFFRKGKNNILMNPIKNEPHRIKVGSQTWDIRFFRHDEVDKMYRGLPRYFKEVS
jgi:hypothetical protein